MAQAPNQTHDYNRVSRSDNALDIGLTAVVEDTNCASSTRFISIAGTGLATLFVFGSIFYAGHCAQLLANKVHGTIYWYPQLAAVGAAFLLLCQSVLLSFPFRRRYRYPVLERYINEGYHTTAQVIKREVKFVGKHKIHKVILLYKPDEYDHTTIYAKKFEVTIQEFGQTSFPIVVIPSIPSSAILEQVYVASTASCGKQCLYSAILSLLGPILWILVIYYDHTMEKYSQTDIWEQWGLGLLFSISLISSILLAYVMVISTINRWLNGGACRVDASQIPENFFGENNSSAFHDDDGGDGSDEVEDKTSMQQSMGSSNIELV